MTPTRKRDLAVIVVVAALVAYILVLSLYRWFPPLTVWTGLSLAAVAVAEAIWGGYVRTKINAGEIGAGGGRLRLARPHLCDLDNGLVSVRDMV